jgi:hypothetical protein
LGAFKGPPTNRAKAGSFAANALPVIRQIQAAGATSYRAIAAALNAHGIGRRAGANGMRPT